MSNGLSGSFNTARLLARVDRVGSAAKASVRPAAQAGAQVYYDELRQRVPVGSKVHSTKGKKHTFSPGNLQRSLYQAYADESTPDRAVYRISWNKQKAFYGGMVERGTSRTPAQAFLRPTYDARRDDAIAASRGALREQIKEGLGK